MICANWICNSLVDKCLKIKYAKKYDTGKRGIRMSDLKAAKTSYVTEVYQQIHSLILNGDWKAGDKLPTEHQLAARFHVSRVVVREALQQLRTEHLIITRHGSGSFVAKPQDFALLPHLFSANLNINLTDEEFQDLMDLRTCIEFRALELAAKRAGRDDLIRIRNALNRMSTEGNDLEAFTMADYDFHFSVILASRNRMFIQVMESCQDQMIYCLREMNKMNANWDWALQMHRTMYECLARHDAAGAIRCLRNNNEYNRAKLATFISETALI